MPDVRFVCLSDLHFGAENSLLTHINLTDTTVTVDPTEASKSLRAFVECLRAVVAHNADKSVKPTLVLAGDVIEFALASDDVAATAFMRFIELAFAKDDPIFDRRMIYVPGNHDHHMWETAREGQYANWIRRHPGEALKPPWHATGMFPPDEESRVVQSDLLAAVLEHMGRGDLRIEVQYPNLGLVARNGERLVVVHHGHFVESMYLLMSALKDTIFPGKNAVKEPWDLEAENFAWIDFFWSTLGRSGDVGADVGLIYDMLGDDKALALMATNAAGFAIRKVKPQFVHRPLRWLVSLVTRRVLKRARRLERKAKAPDPEMPLTKDAKKGLRAYVTGPLAAQVNAERADDHGHTPPLPTDVAFVFGHTHKPFEKVVDWGMGPGGSGTTEIYNTGGWVVDTLEEAELQGAAAVLLDEDLNIASLRLYNQAATKAEYRVRVAAARPSAFSARLTELVDPAAEPFATMSSTAADKVPERCKALGFIIDDGIRQLQGKPALSPGH
jgi:hypothetical protein